MSNTTPACKAENGVIGQARKVEGGDFTFDLLTLKSIELLGSVLVSYTPNYMSLGKVKLKLSRLQGLQKGKLKTCNCDLDL